MLQVNQGLHKCSQLGHYKVVTIDQAIEICFAHRGGGMGRHSRLGPLSISLLGGGWIDCTLLSLSVYLLSYLFPYYHAYIR